MKNPAGPLLLAGLLAAGGAGACLEPDPAPRFTPAWEPLDLDDDGWRSTRLVQVVSDCQFHNLNSLPVPERNLSAESAVATAIRPPQLDLFSPEVLEWILANGSPDAELILHLGDALDLACEAELERYLEVMDGAGRPWFMVPGNHDCFYFGVFDPKRDGLWKDACHEAGRPLRKDTFIRLYLASLVRRDDADGRAFAEVLGLTADRERPLAEVAELIPLEFAWERDPGTCEFLEAIWWHLDPDEPWRSYVTQSIDTSPVDQGPERRFRNLLLDSCQYGRRPALIPNGWRSYPLRLNSGSAGEMLPDQLRLARRWLEEREGSSSLVFHHPFDYLAPRAKSSVGFLRREFEIPLTVTAHTHRGYFAHHDLGGDQDYLELNIASTTDWPMEWREVAGFGNVNTGDSYILAERHTLVDELLQREGFFERDWEIPIDAPDDYRRYKSGEPATGIFVSYYVAYHLIPYWMWSPRVRANRPARRTEEQVKETLLWTYHRLVTTFPSDAEGAPPPWPSDCGSDVDVLARIEAVAALEEEIEAKIALLVELGRFERARSSRDPETGTNTDQERLRFKISQAAWASRFESARGRGLRLEDEVIRQRGATALTLMD